MSSYGNGNGTPIWQMVPPTQYEQQHLQPATYDELYSATEKHLVPPVHRSEAAQVQLEGEFYQAATRDQSDEEQFVDAQEDLSGGNDFSDFVDYSGEASNYSESVDMAMGEDDETQVAVPDSSLLNMEEETLRTLGETHDSGFDQQMGGSDDRQEVHSDGRSEVQSDGHSEVHSEVLSEAQSEAKSEEDLFKSTFGNKMQEDNEDDDLVEMDSGDSFGKVKRPFQFDAMWHKVGCSEKKRRLSTPPRLLGTKTEDIKSGDNKPNGTKEDIRNTLESSVSTKNKEVYRRRDGADIHRDRAYYLNAHWKFHDRVMNYVPRLPNDSSFDWDRRYWIAVLIEGKQPRNVNSEKDFIWMKGNRYSTVCTVFHMYANTVLSDKEDLVLLLGVEKPEMSVQMQSLDYFSDRLIVMKAVKKSHPHAKGLSMIGEIEQPVVQID